ncbi:MAG: FtsQ-type POTRA domain-containing protein [Lentisphaerae bacterium]|nr:FtsQ-type POTRA domain-containing protein [Lentisphaerota bacterium]
MLFDDEEITGRRFGGSKHKQRKPILNVIARARTQRGTVSHRLAVLILIPIVAVFAVVLLWYGISLAGRMLFSQNDRFVIKHLEIKVDESAVISRSLIKEYTQIHKEMNIFEMNISKIRADFLNNAPSVKSMSITRYLPNTLQIEVIERFPLACIVQRKQRDVAVDGHGCVFAAKDSAGKLPLIKKYEGAVLAPGDRVEGMMLAAVQLLEACENPLLGLKIEEIDVGNREYLVLRTPFEGKTRQVKFNWDGMGLRTAAAKNTLLRKLSRLVVTLQSDQGRRISFIDSTFDDRIYGH